jgi:hypothetical protein
MMNKKSCCSIWEKANTLGTDNEGFDSLISYGKKEIEIDEIDDDLARIGTNLEPIRFCPWCGLKKDIDRND